MAHDTIPPPSVADKVLAEAMIARILSGETEPERAAAVVAQLQAEVRWLHSILWQGANT